MTQRRTSTAAIMGTVMSVAGPGGADAESFTAATRAAWAWLRHADEVFSPFKADSAVSRIRDGRLPLADLATHPDGAEIREVLDLCASLTAQSDGAFDAWAVGDPPVFDPCGSVKGWAAERASDVLVEYGLPGHVLGAGGDVRVRGGSGDRPWRVGIVDPHRQRRLLTVAELSDGAVATSGTSERGPHIWDPRADRPASHLAQVTVGGPDLTWADGYATAAMALGEQARGWLTALAGRTGYQALTVDRETGVWWTPGMSEYIPGRLQR
jgi:thiamine biosynthesis lipoprotein